MHLAPLIRDLAFILGVAALFTFIFRKIRQPVVLGYLLAGFLVGPFSPGPKVADIASIKVWAELGVVFLMFSLGLEFSFRRLARVGLSAVAIAAVQLVIMVWLGALTAKFLNWSGRDGLFLGCMISISSTTIIVKAFEELGLKTRGFVQTVLGVLIVEDLIAILMLVSLTTIATQPTFSGLGLAFSAGKLAFVVGSWFIVGMVAIPRFVKSVGRQGSDEILTLTSAALCLLLVVIAASFEYSMALGAFMMGSILAETKEAKRIEHLIQPLKDMFGAIFFVSVGMMLDPQTLVSSWYPVVIITVVIVLGKLASVLLGALVSGETLKNSIKTALSMAQIGEFSYIIASLGESTGSTNPALSPVIVAASLLTTFLTPYLIGRTETVVGFAEKNLPPKGRKLLEVYGENLQKLTSESSTRNYIFRSGIKWFANAIAVVLLYQLGVYLLLPAVKAIVPWPPGATGLAWLSASLCATPMIWGMVTAFRLPPGKSPTGAPQVARVFGGLVTALFVGLQSLFFFNGLLSLVFTLAIFGGLVIIFRHRLEDYYSWIENRFFEGFGESTGSLVAATGGAPGSAAIAHLTNALAPWDAHLAALYVPVDSSLVGKSLASAQVRENFGINIVAIQRGQRTLVAPHIHEAISSGDQLLCFGGDEDLEKFQKTLEQPTAVGLTESDLSHYSLVKHTLENESPWLGIRLRDSRIREDFGCLLVGLDRGKERFKTPPPDLILQTNDILWLVGPNKKLSQLTQFISPKTSQTQAESGEDGGLQPPSS